MHSLTVREAGQQSIDMCSYKTGFVRRPVDLSLGHPLLCFEEQNATMVSLEVQPNLRLPALPKENQKSLTQWHIRKACTYLWCNYHSHSQNSQISGTFNNLEQFKPWTSVGLWTFSEYLGFYAFMHITTCGIKTEEKGEETRHLKFVNSWKAHCPIFAPTGVMHKFDFVNTKRNWRSLTFYDIQVQMGKVQLCLWSMKCPIPTPKALVNLASPDPLCERMCFQPWSDWHWHMSFHSLGLQKARLSRCS